MFLFHGKGPQAACFSSELGSQEKNLMGLGLGTLELRGPFGREKVLIWVGWITGGHAFGSGCAHFSPLREAAVRERCPARRQQHNEPEGCLDAAGSLQPEK